MTIQRVRRRARSTSAGHSTKNARPFSAAMGRKRASARTFENGWFGSGTDAGF